MTATIHDRLVAGLSAMGNKKPQLRKANWSAKYTILERANKQGNYYFIGRAGALRTGRNATESRVCHDEFRRLVLERGDAALRASAPARVPAGAPVLSITDLDFTEKEQPPCLPPSHTSPCNSSSNVKPRAPSDTPR